MKLSTSLKVVGCSGDLEGLVEEALRRDSPTLFVVGRPKDVVDAAMAVALRSNTPYYYIPLATVEDPRELEDIDGIVVLDAASTPHSSLQKFFTLRKPILIITKKEV